MSCKSLHASMHHIFIEQRAPGSAGSAGSPGSAGSGLGVPAPACSLQSYLQLTCTVYSCIYLLPNSEHNDFVANVAHSGDAAPDYDIEAPRFDHHGRTWASWTHTAFMRQAVACATAVATFGGATYAAKCEMRDIHSAASHHQVGELAEDAEPLEPMPEPMCAA